ncbi:hypothetical protein PFLmoz3_00777 [Pseudomonas fluorescens]|uniref:Uncharacterized protein n=1 Tax=Pseudomonas fluorescens TaxID=294 RepID=A0A125QJ49_PSEFL|nr:hypothetical protein PFLmoz3_00777 [Pseudomonas fluorescens]
MFLASKAPACKASLLRGRQRLPLAQMPSRDQLHARPGNMGDRAQCGALKAFAGGLFQGTISVDPVSPSGWMEPVLACELRLRDRIIRVLEIGFPLAKVVVGNLVRGNTDHPVHQFSTDRPQCTVSPHMGFERAWINVIKLGKPLERHFVTLRLWHVLPITDMGFSHGIKWRIGCTVAHRHADSGQLTIWFYIAIEHFRV